ncbi:STAS domain-containing protein [Streptomyces sp. NPDC004976]
MAEREMSDTGHIAHSGRLSVAATSTESIRVVSLAGEIDYHTVDILRQALIASDVARPRIVVDMRQVTFMDSSGLNIFIAAHHAATEAGGWLRLAALTDSVKRTVQMTGVDTFIDCHETLPQALGD